MRANLMRLFWEDSPLMATDGFAGSGLGESPLARLPGGRKIRGLRRVVTGALELERAAKRIGSSLEAHPVVHATASFVEALDGADLAEIGITSAATLGEGEAPEGAFTLEDVPGVAVVVDHAEGGKCQRCWKVLDEVDTDPDYPGVCGRCAEVVRARGLAPS